MIFKKFLGFDPFKPRPRVLDDRSYIEAPKEVEIENKVQNSPIELQGEAKESKQPIKKPTKAKTTRNKPRSKKPETPEPEIQAEAKTTKRAKKTEKAEIAAPRRSARSRKKPDRYTA